MDLNLTAAGKVEICRQFPQLHVGWEKEAAQAPDSPPDVSRLIVPPEDLDRVDGIRPSNSRTRAVVLLPAIQEEDTGTSGQLPETESENNIQNGRRPSTKPTLTSISEESLPRRQGSFAPEQFRSRAKSPGQKLGAGEAFQQHDLQGFDNQPSLITPRVLSKEIDGEMSFAEGGDTDGMELNRSNNALDKPGGPAEKGKGGDDTVGAPVKLSEDSAHNSAEVTLALSQGEGSCIVGEFTQPIDNSEDLNSANAQLDETNEKCVGIGVEADVSCKQTEKEKVSDSENESNKEAALETNGVLSSSDVQGGPYSTEVEQRLPDEAVSQEDSVFSITGSSRAKGSGSDSVVADGIVSNVDVAGVRESHSDHTSFSEKSEQTTKAKDGAVKTRGRDRERGKRSKRNDREDRDDRGEQKSLKNAVGDVHAGADDSSIEVTVEEVKKALVMKVQGQDNLSNEQSTMREESSGDVSKDAVKSTCGLESQTVTSINESASDSSDISSLREHEPTWEDQENMTLSHTPPKGNPTSRFGKRTQHNRQRQGSPREGSPMTYLDVKKHETQPQACGLGDFDTQTPQSIKDDICEARLGISAGQNVTCNNPGEAESNSLLRDPSSCMENEIIGVGDNEEEEINLAVEVVLDSAEHSLLEASDCDVHSMSEVQTPNQVDDGVEEGAQAGVSCGLGHIELNKEVFKVLPPDNEAVGTVIEQSDLAKFLNVEEPKQNEVIDEKSVCLVSYNGKIECLEENMSACVAEDGAVCCRDSQERPSQAAASSFAVSTEGGDESFSDSGSDSSGGARRSSGGQRLSTISNFDKFKANMCFGNMCIPPPDHTLQNNISKSLPKKDDIEEDIEAQALVVNAEPEHLTVEPVDSSSSEEIHPDKIEKVENENVASVDTSQQHEEAQLLNPAIGLHVPNTDRVGDALEEALVSALAEAAEDCWQPASVDITNKLDGKESLERETACEGTKASSFENDEIVIVGENTEENEYSCEPLHTHDAATEQLTNIDAKTKSCDNSGSPKEIEEQRISSGEALIETNNVFVLEDDKVVEADKEMCSNGLALTTVVNDETRSFDQDSDKLNSKELHSEEGKRLSEDIGDYQSEIGQKAGCCFVALQSSEIPQNNDLEMQQMKPGTESEINEKEITSKGEQEIVEPICAKSDKDGVRKRARWKTDARGAEIFKQVESEVLEYLTSGAEQDGSQVVETVPGDVLIMQSSGQNNEESNANTEVVREDKPATNIKDSDTISTNKIEIEEEASENSVGKEQNLIVEAAITDMDEDMPRALKGNNTPKAEETVNVTTPEEEGNDAPIVPMETEEGDSCAVPVEKVDDELVIDENNYSKEPSVSETADSTLEKAGESQVLLEAEPIDSDPGWAEHVIDEIDRVCDMDMHKSPVTENKPDTDHKSVDDAGIVSLGINARGNRCLGGSVWTDYSEIRAGEVGRSKDGGQRAKRSKPAVDVENVHPEVMEGLVRRITVVGVEAFPQDKPCVYHPERYFEPVRQKQSESGSSKKKSTLWKRFKTILRPTRSARRDRNEKLEHRYKENTSCASSDVSGGTTLPAPILNLRQHAVSDDTLDISRGNKNDPSQGPRHKAKIRQPGQWRRLKKFRALRLGAERRGNRLPATRRQIVSKNNFVREAKSGEISPSGHHARRRHRSSANDLLLLEPSPRDPVGRSSWSTPEVAQVFRSDEDLADGRPLTNEATVRTLLKPTPVVCPPLSPTGSDVGPCYPMMNEHRITEDSDKESNERQLPYTNTEEQNPFFYYNNMGGSATFNGRANSNKLNLSATRGKSNTFEGANSARAVYGNSIHGSRGSKNCRLM